MNTEKHRKLAEQIKVFAHIERGWAEEGVLKLLATFEREVRLETLEEAARHCESRRGLMETGAWRILDAIARELRDKAGAAPKA